MSELLTEPEFGDENPMPTAEDPIIELIEKPFENLTDKEIEQLVTKLSEASNNPKAFSRLITGKSKKKKKPAKKKAEDVMFQKMLANL